MRIRSWIKIEVMIKSSVALCQFRRSWGGPPWLSQWKGLSHFIRIREFEFPAVSHPADEWLTGRVVEEFQQKLPQLDRTLFCWSTTKDIYCLLLEFVVVCFFGIHSSYHSHLLTTRYCVEFLGNTHTYIHTCVSLKSYCWYDRLGFGQVRALM